MSKFLPLLLSLFLFTACTSPRPKLAWGDQGDGTYKNPILKADFSDPDVVRVGNDYFLIASDFHFVGIQLLHSNDLVNWTCIGQIFNKLTMAPKYDAMTGYAEGTWAPSIRYHNGEFYVYVCTPGEGLFMWHAKNPAGPWSDTVTVKAVANWEDPCPFWDDDGTGYLVRSRKFAGPIILHKLSPDGTTLLDEGTEIYNGPTAEGPKMFKRNGYYYISLPEGGVGGGSQVVIRSKTITGPYEKKTVLEAGAPHQGALVDTPTGESWFIGFSSAGWQGRICHLEPVVWGDDNWPTFGDHGKHVAQAKKPAVSAAVLPDRPTLPQVSDDFSTKTLNPIWQWNHNPINDSWSLAGHALLLRATPAVNLTRARNTLAQKLWDDYGILTVQLDPRQMADGQYAGLAFQSGNVFASVGIVQENGKRHLSAIFPPAAAGRGLSVAGVATGPATAPAPSYTGPEVSGPVTLRGQYQKDGTASFAFSTDSKAFTPIPGTTTLRFLSWKGARAALFSYTRPDAIPGTAGFSNFQYRYFSTAEDLAVAAR